MTNAKPDVQPDPLEAISVLGERNRRSIYDHVSASDGWVSRDVVAAATGIGRATAAHHLDRLAGEGLLEVDYQRLSGRTGPGAGRPAKLYRRSDRQFAVSLPPRDYELAGEILAEAVDRARRDGTQIDHEVTRAASSRGEGLAEEIRCRISAGGRGSGRRRRAIIDVLEVQGFEPAVDADGVIRLRNCPFHRLARLHTELVCGMNHCVLSSALSDEDTGFEARLEPAEGACCVRLHPT